MTPKFSQELRNELIQYFENFHGLVISDSQADEFLDSLGEFYLWINSSEERRPPP
jgi:hypothetical protein